MMRFILLVVFAAHSVFAAEYGTFVVVKGKVLIDNGSGTTEAKLNSKIQVGETVITDQDSRAKIVMFDRNIINVAPNTKLKFEKYTNSKDDKNVKLKLIEGKVRSKVSEKYDNKTSRFEIRTATAVAGVRGTDFITSYDPQTKTTEVLTFRGTVAFTSMTPGESEGTAGEPVLVNKGEKSQSQAGGSATEPAKVPAKELNQADLDSSVKDKETKDKEMAKDKDGKKDKKDRKDKKDKDKDKDKGAEEPAGEDSGGAMNNQPPIVEPVLNTIITAPPPTNTPSKSKVIITIKPGG